MSKAIYSLKMFIFREDFILTKKEYNSISSICIFIINLYVKAWFNAPIAAFSPYQDLEFLKNLYEYKNVDEELSKNAIKKFINHLWYLTQENIALAFFDKHISCETKTKMAKMLKTNANDNVDTDENNTFADKRIHLNVNEVPNFINNYFIEDFVSSKTIRFFERFNINLSFIETDPSTWDDNLDYCKGKEIVNNLKVVNDTAERAVKLIEDFNKIGTKNEEQKQYMLQVITKYRKEFPHSNKCTIMEQ